MVAKYSLELQGRLQILETQSGSSHLRPKVGEAFLKVAAAERENGEEERRGGETGAGERAAGTGKGEKGQEGKREKKPLQRSTQGGAGSFWDRSGVGTAKEKRVVGGG